MGFGARGGGERGVGAGGRRGGECAVWVRGDGADLGQLGEKSGETERRGVRGVGEGKRSGWECALWVR